MDVASEDKIRKKAVPKKMIKSTTEEKSCEKLFVPRLKQIRRPRFADCDGKISFK